MAHTLLHKYELDIQAAAAGTASFVALQTRLVTGQYTLLVQKRCILVATTCMLMVRMSLSGVIWYGAVWSILSNCWIEIVGCRYRGA